MKALRYLAAPGVAGLLIWLAACGVVKQDVADPITTSPLPQPDWLFLLFFQVTRYARDSLEMAGVFWIPGGIVLALLALPLLDHWVRKKSWLKWTAFSCGLIVLIMLGVLTSHTGGTTPLNSCGACHKEGFGQSFALPPAFVKDFSQRYDNNWLAVHYRYPQYFWMMDANVPAW